MFGYVIVNKPELKIKDFECYQSFYCGLCQALKDGYGRIGQLSLNYDLTFVALVLSALYEVENSVVDARCLLHPQKKHCRIMNEFSGYCADMTILLTYLKCCDDCDDEHHIRSKVMKRFLQPYYDMLKAKYPEKTLRIETALQENYELEHSNCGDLDRLASLSGVLMGEVLAVRDDEWHDSLYEMGDYLGRFIYIMDAFDDREDDEKQQRFNPLIQYAKQMDFDQRIYEILELMMANSARAFEKLPILLYVDLIRNILYSGVWAKFETIKKKRTGDDHAGSI